MNTLQISAFKTGAALLMLSLSSCAQVPTQASSEGSAQVPTQAIFESEPQALGQGTVRTYVELNAQNQPQEIGVILTEAALVGLPTRATEVVLPLPAQAATTAFNHIGLDWRSHGHDPMPIYGSPHFDIHVYTLTPEEREQITLAEADLEKVYRTPEPDLIPTGYVLAPNSAEPRMGAHWVNTIAEELQGDPHGFNHTLIYGFYDGAMTFIEPMVTLDFLESQQNFEGSIALPERYVHEGTYPTGYRISYNQTTREHTIALTDFAKSSSTLSSLHRPAETP